MTLVFMARPCEQSLQHGAAAVRTACGALAGLLKGSALVLRFAPRQAASAVVLGEFMSVEGIARITLRQTGEQAAGFALVLVAER